MVMKYINYLERKMIEKMLKDELSLRSIAKVLNRGHSTISDEIRKNKSPHEKEYNADLAHQRHLKRQQNKGNKAKLEQNPELKAFVIEQITEEQWSPEQIAGFLELVEGKKVINHETIYQFIYSEEGRRLKLWLYLRHKRKPSRRPRGQRKSRGITIKERVSISERPQAANERKEFGHLESDSMIFSKQRPILSVQAERMTQKCTITILCSKEAKETNYALRRSIEEYGETHVKSITYDNGTENAWHYEINREYMISSYFCRAYASWQKGLVENINKLIRQYFPRYTNMEHINQDDVEVIQEKLNNRPRKKLGYLTPNQAYEILAQGGRLRT
jgi:transposase, IS30 family